MWDLDLGTSLSVHHDPTAPLLPPTGLSPGSRLVSQNGRVLENRRMLRHGVSWGQGLQQEVLDKSLGENSEAVAREAP